MTEKNDIHLSAASYDLTSCRRAAATVCPAHVLPRGCWSALRRRADGNVAAVSHGQHVLTPTAAAAWRVKAAVSEAVWWPWPLTIWPWKWCPSHVWRGLPLCQFWYRPLGSRLRSDVRDRQTSDRHQTKASLNAPLIWGGSITSCIGGRPPRPRYAPA